MLLVFAFVSLLLSIPAITVLVETLAAILLPDRNLAHKNDGRRRASYIVLVPAHNESQVIEKTILSLTAQVCRISDITVVADNCTDATAKLAADLGVSVLERFNEQQRGKGYALDYGIQHLKANPPDVLVIMDADCQVVEGTLAHLADAAHKQNRPIQSAYIMSCLQEASIHHRIATFAFYLKNFIRPLGLARLGMPCLLTGTGMALPWAAVEKVNFATGNIVEDMQIGIELSLAGYCPGFMEEVQVTSTFPQEKGALRSQRRRWEHGHLDTLLQKIPPLLLEALKQKRFDFLVLAMEGGVPPLSLYGFLTVAYGVLTWLVLAWTGSGLPILGFVFSPFIILTLSLLLAWGRYGRKFVPCTELLRVPFYILQKIPLYISFLFKPEKVWRKTKRDRKEMD